MTTTDEIQAEKLKRLKVLALETAKLAAEVFRDALTGIPSPGPGPRPQQQQPQQQQQLQQQQQQSNQPEGSIGPTMMGGPVPPTPWPKFALIIDGALSIAQGVECLEKK